MGSYCSLYIGDHEYSWKSYVPDPISTLFVTSDYQVRSRRVDWDDESYSIEEHLLLSDCGTARARLEAIGVDLSYLRKLYFFAFAFDYEGFVESLQWRCQQYLASKCTNENVGKEVDKLVRRLLAKFKRMSADEEFNYAISKSRCTGNRNSYEFQMRARINQIRLDRNSEKNAPLSPDSYRVDFSRSHLLDLVTGDPYVLDDIDLQFHAGSGAPDLDFVYEIGMPIFASDNSIPIEFEFTELAPTRRAMQVDEVSKWLQEGMLSLGQRAKLSSLAFGSNIPAEIGSISLRSVRHDHESISTKEKGNALEAIAVSIFESEFEVRQNIRRSDQEIDIVVLNRLNDPFWMSMQSPILLVECRNHRKKIGARAIRDFEVKVQNHAGFCRLGIVISLSGFTRECRTVALRASRESYKILLVGPRELEKRLTDFESTSEWLEDILLRQD